MLETKCVNENVQLSAKVLVISLTDTYKLENQDLNISVGEFVCRAFVTREDGFQFQTGFIIFDDSSITIIHENEPNQDLTS